MRSRKESADGPSSPGAAPPHRIRLRHPWQSERTESGTRWRRRFNRPTGLSARQRVWIVVEGVAAPGAAALNGRALGRLGEAGVPPRFDVTDLLLLHNEIELTLETAWLEDAGATALPGEVCLEIHGR